MKKKQVSESLRAHVYYSGRVQGVGFRFTAERFALDLGLTGWVKNLPDGRVEVVCEGPRDRIEAFLEKIKQSPLGRGIQRAACTWQDATSEFTDFTVEFQL
ncbi:MAG TPA: acylphosphatase [Candidatus Eisenbacteria bacterium]|nr:acylphosphatase [Candidatus Eisenbacteria bacterium]